MSYCIECQNKLFVGVYLSDFYLVKREVEYIQDILICLGQSCHGVWALAISMGTKQREHLHIHTAEKIRGRKMRTVSWQEHILA